MRPAAKQPFNLDFQPQNYWSTNGSAAGTVGSEIGRQLRRAAKSGDTSNFKLPSMSFGLRGGDFLPNRALHELEIACIALDSVTGDVISIRARSTKGRIQYRIVDEYGSRYLISPKSSRRPLTMRQLIGMIDTAQNIGEPYADPADQPKSGGLLAPIADLRRRTFEENWCVEDILGHADFYTITSGFYPQLEDYYHDQIHQWLVEALGYDPYFELPVGERWCQVLEGTAAMIGRSIRCDIWSNGLAMWLDLPCGESVIMWNPEGWSDDDGVVTVCGADQGNCGWKVRLE